MFGMEILDKAADISRDYLVAPAATTSAPAMDVLPKPWPEFIMALLFIIVVFAVKGFHKRYKDHHHPSPGGTPMQAGDLRTGDVFCYVDPEEWLAMSQRDKSRQRRFTVVGLGPECKTDRSRIHLATDHGMHCVPFVAQTTRVQAQSRPHVPAKSRALVGA